MAAAIALAVVLVIAVAGMSLAMQAQRPLQPNQTRQPRTPRPPVPGRVRRVRDRPTPPPPPPMPDPTPMPTVESKGPELLRSGLPAKARVVNVVDERVVGPVTRSRLTLSIQPEGSESFEVTIRHAFQTIESRAAVKVGGTVAVRYDKDEHRKVVIDPEGDTGS
jgi:hypothetical protein